MEKEKRKRGRPPGKTPTEKERFVSFFVPVGLANKLKAVAALEGNSIRALMLRLIEQHVSKVRW